MFINVYVLFKYVYMGIHVHDTNIKTNAYIKHAYLYGNILVVGRYRR